MKPGSKIAWEFRLEKKDIGLSATFQRWESASQSEPTTETIIEYYKIFAEHGAVTGSYSPEGEFAKGTITFAWDNSFSKMCVSDCILRIAFIYRRCPLRTSCVLQRDLSGINFAVEHSLWLDC